MCSIIVLNSWNENKHRYIHTDIHNTNKGTLKMVYHTIRKSVFKNSHYWGGGRGGGMEESGEGLK